MTEQPQERVGGRTVLVVPVPQLDGWVRERTAFYDASFLSEDPAFVNAHITLLGPWSPAPSAADLARVASIAETTPAFAFTLEEIAAFPDGIVYLAPSPAEPFATLTARLAQAFGDFPPYGGAFEQVVPHLTLDQIGEEVTISSVRRSLGGLIPTRARATRIDLQWWQNDQCRLLRSWPLGS